MTARIRPYRKGGWEADIRIVLPNGTPYRDRRKAPTKSKSAATRWAEARERELLINGPPTPKQEVPTLAAFAPRFLAERARANQHEPSGIAHKKTVLRVHLILKLGQKPLDAITMADIQRLTYDLKDRKAKTVNNVLTVLNTLLRKAVEWEVIEGMPCTIHLLKVSQVVQVLRFRGV